MRIDSHLHVWDLSVRDQPWTADKPPLQRSFATFDVRPALAAHHFDATVVVQTVPVADETPELLALAATDPMVTGVVGWVDLTAEDVSARLAALRAQPGGEHLVGIRHPVQGEPDPHWLGRRDVRQGLAAVAEADLAYDLLVGPAQLPAAVESAAELPQLRFVLDHAGRPDIACGVLDPWRATLRELAELPNVAVKLSGLVTAAGGWTVDRLRPYADVLLDLFGAERVMFGSDWPVCQLAASYENVVAAAEQLTPDADRAAVFGDTAARWYKL